MAGAEERSDQRVEGVSAQELVQELRSLLLLSCGPACSCSRGHQAWPALSSVQACSERGARGRQQHLLVLYVPTWAVYVCKLQIACAAYQ